MAENNNLPILREENVRMIVQSGPDTYNTNALSTQRCADFGQRLLSEIQTSGMSDDLDKRCADYIEKARRTIKTMNERRSPITKLFDQIRSEFTGMENTIDPTKKDTIPYQIQQARNTYAAKKREEAERIRQEELRRQQREQAINKYHAAVEDNLRAQFDTLVRTDLDFLTRLNTALSLDNFVHTTMQLKSYSVELDPQWILSAHPRVMKPLEISDAQAFQILKEIKDRIAPALRQQYKTEIGEYRDTLLEQLPSKHRELERMAAANAEEQARLKKELEAREAASPCH